MTNIGVGFENHMVFKSV